RVQVSTSNTFVPLTLDDSTVTATSRQVSALANGTTYYWRVNAKNSGGISTWSSIWNYTTTVSGPAAFGLSSPSNGSSNQGLSGTLAWQSSTGATGYDVFLDTSNPPPTDRKSVVKGKTLAR